MFDIFWGTNGITLVCMVFAIIILAIYLLKEKAKSLTGKVFFALTISTIITMISSICWGTAAIFDSKWTNLLAKIFSFLIVCWDYMLIFYISIVFKTDKENREYYEKHDKISYVLGTILILVNLAFVIFLKFESVYVESENVFITGGPLNLYFNIMGGIAILYALVTIISYRKRLDSLTKILGIFAIIVCSASVILGLTELMKVNDICFLHTIAIMFLYLSLESQDKAILEEFNESNEKSKKTNELKSEFIMNMSHQLRTPMNTILGFSDSLLSNETITQSELIEDSLSIETAAKKLLDMINSILDISKIESNKEIVNNEDYTLDSIIYDVSSHINSKIDKENLVFAINANSNCPNDLHGDAYKISKILNVILTTVIKNTEYGEVSLNVSSTIVDAEYHEFTFHIKNTGHSTSTMDFDKDFEDLIKLNSDGNNDIDADTLKIIAVKGLLNILDGKIDFINQVGQGVQYIIKIKQKVTSMNELGNIREKIQTRQEISQVKLDLTGKKILIVDDKKINTILLQRLLKQYKVEVEDTTNPRDGVEKVKNNIYDLVFVNHEMEEMSGEDFVKKLETTGNKLPPIIGLLTGINEILDIKNYTATLDCPIEYRRLNKAINRIFEDK